MELLVITITQAEANFYLMGLGKGGWGAEFVHNDFDSNPVKT
jgi:hypothetical protein